MMSGHSREDDDLCRVVVIGTSGAGKTTFARALAQLLNAPHVELDALFWGPKWTPRDAEVFQAAVEQASAAQRWVIDGNYSRIRDVVWPRATAIAWLNYPFRTVFWRVLSRTLIRVVRREQIFSGNRESWRKAFLSRESLLWWVITSYRRRRRVYGALFRSGTLPNARLFEFRSPSQTRSFLEAVKNAPDRSRAPDDCQLLPAQGGNGGG